MLSNFFDTLSSFIEDGIKNSGYQIFKYICCGGITVLVDQIIYYTLGLHILPIFQHTDPIVEYLGIHATYVSKSISDNNFIIV